MEFEKRQSVLGILSTIFSLLSCFMICVVITIVVFLEEYSPGYLERNNSVDTLLAITFFASILVSIIGIILGMIGFFQKARLKLFSIIGVLLGVLTIVSLFILLLVGIFEKEISEKLAG